jgi:hypothetical protein
VFGFTAEWVESLIGGPHVAASQPILLPFALSVSAVPPASCRRATAATRVACPASHRRATQLHTAAPLGWIHATTPLKRLRTARLARGSLGSVLPTAAAAARGRCGRAWLPLPHVASLGQRMAHRHRGCPWVCSPLPELGVTRRRCCMWLRRLGSRTDEG